METNGLILTSMISTVTVAQDKCKFIRITPDISELNKHLFNYYLVTNKSRSNKCILKFFYVKLANPSYVKLKKVKSDVKLMKNCLFYFDWYGHVTRDYKNFR